MSTAALDDAPNCGTVAGPRGDMAGRRMCVICRRKAGPDAFVQLKQASPGAVAPGTLGHKASKNGRGAYVCIALSCLARVQQKTLDRALRGAAVDIPTGDALLSHLGAMAEARVLNLLGLARRCGTLVFGIDQVQRWLPEPGGFYVMADDLADRSVAKLAPAEVFLSGERLGQAVGIGFVGAMGIRPGRLARQAAYWLRLWYETDARRRPTQQDTSDGCAGNGGFGQTDQKRKAVEVA